MDRCICDGGSLSVDTAAFGDNSNNLLFVYLSVVY